MREQTEHNVRKTETQRKRTEHNVIKTDTERTNREERLKNIKRN